jgi:hypothetical protein
VNAADPIVVQDHLTLKNERVAKIMKAIELVCQLSLGAMQRFTSRCRRFFVLDLNMQIF